MLNYIIIMAGLALGIWGWIKSEKTSKRMTMLALIAMIFLAIAQMYTTFSSGKQVSLLETKANKAQRGIVEVYDFKGIKRIQSAGNHTVVSGTEPEKIFPIMKQFYDEKKYTELTNLCKMFVEKYPEWLTPYFFLGATYRDLGEIEKAKVQLQYVVEKAAGDPAYSAAEKLLQQIQE